MELNTFSIVARCPRSGKLGVAVSTAVGAMYDLEDYPWLDLRVDEHATPVAELRRVFEIGRLQLLPFDEGMPRKGAPAGPMADDVRAMLLRPPPERPGGGGSGPQTPS